MLTLSGNARIFLYQNPTDMRKSFEGLSSAIQETFPGLLMSGSYFVFLNKRGDYMKVLYWDSDGFAIWCKRLEKGSFSRKGSQVLDRKQFLMLFVGSPKGGKAAAVLFSLVQTCRNLEINPQEYLEDIMRRIMDHSAQRLDELLPDQWLLTQEDTS